ncbi:MAG: bifunctional diaminohydroxyphosphoribosylaminopyrimidine deaminase/5-amino-6-(5-phosphoribosylamino)uracil reductase RibD [Christensenellales bacterium]|jgi:diaminohydroxyphosphoribosylaminopyrimidine deaminase/5-amino-6-(5-phosphoribosylamino)uracil reductase
MDERGYMKRALALARRGWGKTNPNPLVGAVVVRDGRIVAEGYHARLGAPHAEAAAFENAKEDVGGGTLYVNLEPCSHHGRTPPCAQAVIKRGIRRVVVAMEDPNPLVAGSGIRMLREAGIDVTVGLLGDEAKQLNEIFVKHITKKRPFVIMKAAMTLCGKIATAAGDSKWITGEKARRHVHRIRDRVSAIMVGIGTVLADDPSLTTRLGPKKGRDPVRIVVDSRGRIPLGSRAIASASEAGLILATTPAIDPGNEARLVEKGVNVIRAEGADGRVDLVALMDALHALEIDSVLLEGGGVLNASALKSGIVDKAMVFVAPKLVGGAGAKTPVEGPGVTRMDDALRLRDVAVRRFGDDILVEGYIRDVYRDR